MIIQMERHEIVLQDLLVGKLVDLLDPDLHGRRASSLYSWMRCNWPVYRDSNGLVWVFLHSDIVSVERDVAHFSSNFGTTPLIDMSADRSMINLDDPEHLFNKRMIGAQLSPGALGAKLAIYSLWADELIELCKVKAATTGSFDVVGDFASILPSMIVADLLGLGRQKWERCRYWAQATLGAGSFPWTDERIPDFMSAYLEFRDAVAEAIVQKRAEPDESFISLWANGEIERCNGSMEKMSDEEIQNEAILILDGGAETSSNAVSAGLFALLENPDQLLAARDYELMLATGVEEIIRYVTPIRLMCRNTVADCKIGEFDVKAGEQIVLLYTSANQDETVFQDPLLLNLQRKATLHVGFGVGTHRCVGRHLAKFEVALMLERLLQLDSLKVSLSGGAQPKIRPGFFINGLERLDVSCALSN